MNHDPIRNPGAWFACSVLEVNSETGEGAFCDLGRGAMLYILRAGSMTGILTRTHGTGPDTSTVHIRPSSTCDSNVFLIRILFLKKQNTYCVMLSYSALFCSVFYHIGSHNIGSHCIGSHCIGSHCIGSHCTGSHSLHSLLCLHVGARSLKVTLCGRVTWTWTRRTRSALSLSTTRTSPSAS